MDWLRRLIGRERAPADRWNEFLDHYGMRHFNDVEPDLQPSFAVYHYFSEVYNGGHLQFFLNRIELPHETVSSALDEIAGSEAAGNFDNALATWRTWIPEAPETSKEFVTLAVQNNFEAEDKFVYQINPSIDDRLIRYMTDKRLI